MIERTADDVRFAALMAAAQTGDSKAYMQLLIDMTPHVRRLIRRHRRFLRAEDVEDLVQDVLLSVHVVRATYDSRRPFLPWLFAITRNRLADGARRYARQAAHEVLTGEIDVTFSQETTNTPNESYGDPDALREAIEALPRGQREAIQMLKLREMSLKEAARASGTTIGALKVATHRAMATLRKRFIGEK